LAWRIALAVAAPIVVAVVWALMVAPQAPVDIGSALRLVLEVVIFAGAVTALLLRRRVLLAVLLAAIYVVNRVLMAVWDQ
jgi:hypothetical protein